MSDVQRDVYRKLRYTTYYLKNELYKKIENNGITWQQFHALYHIENIGISFNELAKELSCNASNMTGLIDRMVDNGWVYREHSEKDRRVWMIKLTAAGSKLREELLPIHQNNIKQVMSALSEDELQILDSLLSKLSNTGDMS